MDQVLKDLLLPIVIAALLGFLKWLKPKLADRVPGFIWPIFVLVLAKLGSMACESMGVECSGNPFDWTQPQAQIFATGVLAIVAREVTNSIRAAAPKIDQYLASKGLLTKPVVATAAPDASTAPKT